MPNLRLFIGIDLPVQVKEAIAKAKVNLEPYIKGRWIAPENLHLTLKFIGSVDAEKVELISEKVAKAAVSFSAFTVKTTNFGFFPNSKRARIFWLGLTNQHLTDLAKVLENNLAELGYQPEKRPFQPHITLVRFKQPQKLAPDIEQKLPQLNISFTINELILFSSQLKPTGAEYQALRRFPLLP